MSKVATAYTCALAFVLAWLAMGPDSRAQSASASSPAKIKLTTSRETTYIDGPFNDDGTPNYFEYLRAKTSKGITKDNNAAVLMIKAMGPLYIDEKIRKPALAELGLLALDEKGDYFVGIQDYAAELVARGDVPADLKKHLETEDGPESVDDFARDQLELAWSAPWPAPEHIMVAQWLKANENSLKSIVQATTMPRYHFPLLAISQPPMVLDVFGMPLRNVREVAKALTARAMLHAGEGDMAAASADLLAVHRLARLTVQEPTLIHWLVGLAVDAMACEAETKLAISGLMKADEAVKHIAAVQKLGAYPYPMAALELERLVQLDAVMMVYRGGPQTLRRLTTVDVVPIEPPSAGWLAIRDTIDADAVLREINAWHDRFEACWKHDTYAARKKALNGYSSAQANLVKKVGDLKAIADAVTTAAEKSDARLLPTSLTMAEALVANVTGLDRRIEMGDKVRQSYDLGCVAMAIAAFKADTGKYPAKLDDLAPKYMKQVPMDQFTGKPLGYKLTQNGYILYSFGPNMKDDNGATESGNATEDWDIVVTAP